MPLLTWLVFLGELLAVAAVRQAADGAHDDGGAGREQLIGLQTPAQGTWQSAPRHNAQF